MVSAPATPISTAAPPSFRLLRTGVLLALALAAVLTAIALLRYPGSARQMPTTILFAVGAFGVLILLAAWVALIGTRPTTDAAQRALALGSRTGLAAGILWILEISFNNVLPPAISVPQRDTVDNIVWLVIVLMIFATSIIGAIKTASFSSGVLIGLWSGLVSGLLACLAGLALVVFRIDLLLRDPLAQAEYTIRGPSSGAPDMASYFARDTMAGAFGHLVLLGIIAGLLLGVLASVSVRIARALRKH